jgi:hypothetical protein
VPQSHVDKSRYESIDAAQIWNCSTPQPTPARSQPDIYLKIFPLHWATELERTASQSSLCHTPTGSCSRCPSVQPRSWWRWQRTTTHGRTADETRPITRLHLSLPLLKSSNLQFGSRTFTTLSQTASSFSPCISSRPTHPREHSGLEPSLACHGCPNSERYVLQLLLQLRISLS